MEEGEHDRVFRALVHWSGMYMLLVARRSSESLD